MKPVTSFEGRLSVPYHWHYGKVLSEFFEGLRNRKFLASKCPQCGRVSLPPTSFCGICYVPVSGDLMSISTVCRIDTFTVVRFKYPGQLLPPPYAVGVLKPVEADTRFHHLVRSENLDAINIGAAVKPVWREEREGEFFDIEYFEPVEK
ncbi:MAG: Zn-ribbon domain-containing OB-fold protein [bacterium]